MTNAWRETSGRTKTLKLVPCVPDTCAHVAWCARVVSAAACPKAAPSTDGCTPIAGGKGRSLTRVWLPQRGSGRARERLRPSVDAAPFRW